MTEPVDPTAWGAIPVNPAPGPRATPAPDGPAAWGAIPVNRPAPAASPPSDKIDIFDKKYWTPQPGKIDTSAARPVAGDDSNSQVTEPAEVGHRFIRDAVDTVGGLWDMAKTAGHKITHPSELLNDVAALPGKAADVAKSVAENPGAAAKAVPNFIADQVTQHPANTLATILTGPKNITGGVAKNVAEALPDAVKSPVSSLVGSAMNHFTGVGDDVMQTAYRTGTLGDKIAADFREGMRNPGEAAQKSVDQAKQGIRTMKDAMLDKYADLKKIWSSDETPLSFDSINKAEKDLMSGLTVEGKNGPQFKMSDGDRSKILGMQKVIDNWRQDPSLHNIEGFDALKQRLRNETNYKTDSDVVARASATLSNAAKDAILSQVPDSAVYKKAMQGYFEAADHVNDIERGLALGKKAETNTSISRLQSVMRNNATTLFGTRKNFAEALEREGNVSLMPSLAGQATSSWRPRGILGGVTGGAMPLVAAEEMMRHGFDPAHMAALAATGLATSPRINAEAFHGLGRVNGALGKFVPSSVGYPATAARTAADQPPARRRGGYFGGV